MKVRAIKTYQAVTFEKRTETFFTSIENGAKKTVQMQIRPELMCVEVKTELDHVLIPFTNVSAIHIVTEQAIAEAEEAKAEKANRKTGIALQDIKRPR